MTTVAIILNNFAHLNNTNHLSKRECDCNKILPFNAELLILNIPTYKTRQLLRASYNVVIFSYILQ